MAEPTRDSPRGDVSTETVAKTIENQIAALDPARAESFTHLQKLRSARAAGYAREQKRLALKYGADSPHVAAVAQKSAFNEGLRRDLDFEAARARTETPSADKDSYVFHGFVRDLSGRGMPRLTVALYDEKGDLIRELGFGCTDDRGYFLLRYQRGTSTPPGDAKPTFVFRQPGPSSTTGPGPSAARVYILDAQQTTLQIEKDPLDPQLGQVDFRIIILGAKPEVCTPPPQTKTNKR